TLHGLDRCLPDPLEFCLPRERRGRVAVGRVHTTTVIGRADVLRVDGMRCASATRTIIDLAALDLPVHRLEAAIDSAVRLRLSSPQVLARRLADLRGSGRAGVRILDRLMVDSGGESMLERRFLVIMRRAGLPRPVVQRIVRHDGRHVARVDFSFEQYRIAVEVSGKLGHSSPSERRKDAQRRNELLDLGMRVYEYTWSDVVDRPSHVAATMWRRLRAAGWPAPALMSAG
ncbi:MAG: endonuclease domain-containing protein, partial [Actinomycetota bacterium]|nr:endonuclease domain-containing protein [Actinomycetota bacterium]